jgi:hypothetical protein
MTIPDITGIYVPGFDRTTKLPPHDTVEALRAAIGGTGGGAVTFPFGTPAATWTITHNFGRRPSVELYVDGEIVDGDVESNSTTTTITWPEPTSGEAVLA